VRFPCVYVQSGISLVQPCLTELAHTYFSTDIIARQIQDGSQLENQFPEESLITVLKQLHLAESLNVDIDRHICLQLEGQVVQDFVLVWKDGDVKLESDRYFLLSIIDINSGIRNLKTG
jgi:hypothetical protein